MGTLKCRLLLAGLIAASISAPAAMAQSVPATRVLEIAIDGAVDPLVARYLERSLRDAAAGAYAAVLVRIDTPGGLDSSMRRIVKAIEGSPIPVVCWTGPRGARAASAGAFIMLGCPYATMAPSTAMGAAHPVGFRGEILDEKITNDAAAFARALAQAHGRDSAAAERMVRRSVSFSAEEALRLRLIGAVAATEREALRAFQSSRCGPGLRCPYSAPLGDAPIERAEMAFMESLLHTVVDPNIAFLLLTLGLLGIATEILHPGITVGGVGGGLALLAALVVLGMLPVNIAGLLLIVTGIVLLVVEAYVPGGVVGALGALAVLLGGLFLFDSAIPRARVSTGLVVGTVLIAAATFLVVARAVMRSRRQPLTAATAEDLVGTEGVVERALDPVGIVRARNESWTARAVAGTIPSGAHVRVVRVQGLTLEVEAAGEPAAREV